MHLIKDIPRKHWACFIMALAVSMILSLPSIWIRLDLGEKFDGIYISDIDADYFYQIRVRKAYDGNYKLAEMTVPESVQGPYTQTPGGEIFVALASKLFGLTPAQMLEAGNFIFPFFLAIILYALFYLITGSRGISLLAPIVILLAANIVYNPRNLYNIFFSQGDVSRNSYNRPIHPQISSIFFYSWFFFLYYYYKNKKIHFAIFAGAILGALFYIYPYAWILAVAMIALLCVFSLWKKNLSMLRGLLSMLGVGLVISIPYWINIYQLKNHPLYEVMKIRFILFSDRTFMWSDLLLLDLIMALLLYYKNKSKEKLFFFLVIIFSLFGVINQQVITGTRLFPGHWHWYYAVPISIFIILYTVYEYIKSKKVLLTAFFSLVVFMAFLDGYATQRTYYNEFKDRYASYQRYMDVFDWFNKNSLKGEVVLGNVNFINRMLLYTPNSRYIFDMADLYNLIPPERAMHNFFISLYLKGARTENINEYVNMSTPEFVTLLYGYNYRYTKKCNKCYSPDEVDRVKKEYLEFLKKDFETELKKYRIDYAVEDMTADTAYYLEQYGFMKKTAEINSMNIYKVE